MEQLDIGFTSEYERYDTTLIALQLIIEDLNCGLFLIQKAWNIAPKSYGPL